MARGLLLCVLSSIVLTSAFLSITEGRGIHNKAASGKEEPCVLVSEEETQCVELKYPHPTLCSFYIQCSTNCLATPRWCPRQFGVWLHFSNATQSCVQPETTNCTDNIQPPASPPTGIPSAWPTQLPGDTVSTPIPLFQAAFGVTRSSDVPVGGEQVVDFNITMYSEQSTFDLETDTFTAAASGLYWLHWTVGLPHWSAATNVTLEGLPTRAPSLYRHLPNNGETNSRTELAELTAGTTLTLSSSDTLYSSSTGAYTSFTGFHLQSTMSEVAAFHGAMTVPGGTSTLWWDTILVDTHGGFVSNYYYTVPLSGYWFVTLRCSDSPTFPDFSSTILIVAETYLSAERYYLNHWHSDGQDTYSMSVIFDVPAGYNIGALNWIGMIYGDANYPTAMLGFFISPMNSAKSVVWYVASAGDKIGLLDPLPFELVFQNEGSGWQADRHVFIAPYEGLYYITLNAMKKDSSESELELLIDGAEQASLYFPNSGWPPTRSRDVILRLRAAAELRIRLPANSGILACGSGYVCTSIGGFRLSA